ncbi:hypothetical protein ElyMa_000104100 [Elysia marginata]|uniref:VWA domain-containing protein n=1 Tax=Elysia marginata TaxID=1093978 RepID=A0AAV4EK20_9GAST|nr:hypothetical protein ElyMa_000104100 [Elysia marginata]
MVFAPFAKDLSLSDSISFNKRQTDIGKSLETIQRLYSNYGEKVALLLITDGNTTEGNNYTHQNFARNLRIYPMVVGDTIPKVDLKIENINANPYTSKGNVFPTEIFSKYDGEKPVQTVCEISRNGKKIFSENLYFNKLNRSKVIKAFLKSGTVGMNHFKVLLKPIPKESNILNNKKEFAIEVLDKKVNVIVVSSIVHPDLGTLKKSLKNANGYDFRLIRPKQRYELWKEKGIFILYQPDNNFRNIFRKIQAYKKNYLIITGTKTDWSFLNSIQREISLSTSIKDTEETQPIFNSDYHNFVINNFSFLNYPPLLSQFGTLKASIPLASLFFKSINGISTDIPLMATAESQGNRRGFLFGEGIWKWRMKDYLEHKTFRIFDDLFGKFIYYLSQDNSRDRLVVDSKQFYNQGDVQIVARYFDKDYNFDDRAVMQIEMKNKDGFVQDAIMTLKKGYYKASFNSAPAGSYTYKISVKGVPNMAREGQLKVLEYNAEKQFEKADIDKLRVIAKTTNGELVFSFSQFQNTLFSSEETAKPIVKKISKPIHLLDITWLFLTLVGIFSAEWFLRKRNGLV